MTSDSIDGSTPDAYGEVIGELLALAEKAHSAESRLQFALLAKLCRDLASESAMVSDAPLPSP